MRTAVGLGSALLLACGPGGLSGPPKRSQFLDLDVKSWIGQEPLTTDTVIRPAMALELGEVEYRLGEDPRTDAEEFGSIRQGLFLEDGSVVVSDLAKDRLIYLDPNGQILQVFGRNGQGPGEFYEPSYLISFDGYDVMAYDNGNQRVTRLRSAGKQLVIVEDEEFLPQINRLKYTPDAVCQYDDGLMALAHDVISEHTLHRMSATGKVAASFGRPFSQGTNRYNSATTQGKLLCLPEGRAVVLSTMQGGLMAWDVEGNLLWRRELPDYFPVETKEVGGGVAFRYAPEPLGMSNYVVAMLQVGEGIGLLQIATQALVDGAIVRTGVESRLFDLRDGQERGRQSGIPMVLAVRGDRLLLTDDDPEPWVEVRRFRLIPRQ